VVIQSILIIKNSFLFHKPHINRKDFFNIIKDNFKSGMGTMNLLKIQYKMKGFTFLNLILNLISLIHINHQMNLQNQQYFRVNYFHIFFSLQKN